jgi:hypothetical protein
VIGNEAGVGGGVVSLVNKGMCKPIQWNETVRVENEWVTMHSVEMWMNCMGPEGQGNVQGTLVYIQCIAAAEVTPAGEIVVEEPESPPKDNPPATDSSSPDGESGEDACYGDNAGDQPAEADSSFPDESGAEAQQLAEEEAQLQREIAQAEQELAQAEAEAARLDEELAFELAQLGVDAAGTVDPTPTSDAVSAGMSLSKGDYLGAALSGVSMIPYLGDALAKPAKLARAAKIVAKLKKAISAAKGLAQKAAQKLAKLKDQLAKLRQSKKGSGGSGGGGGGKGPVRVTRAPISISDKQLQKKFKHAKDFGVDGNYSKANAEKYRDAINGHVNDSATQTIQGTYHGSPAVHHYNPNTGVNVITDPSGNFVSGWKLSPTQSQHVLTTGNLGGG